MSNLPVYIQDATLKAARAAEVPDADFDGGMNKGGNSPIGISTAVVNPSGWDLVEDTAARTSQHIGEAATDINVDQGADVNDTVALVAADAQTVADAPLDVATGAVNKTGATVEAGDFTFGVIPVA